MNDDDKKYYIPNKVMIGKSFDLSYYSRIGINRISEIAVPSCRFKMHDWTDMNTFERLSGFRPTNMVDKEKEITKMLSGGAFEIVNTPTNGFRIKEMTRCDLYSQSSYTSQTYFYLEDPRGFIVQVDADYIMGMILDEHMPIDENGKFDMEFVYAWQESWCDDSKPGEWKLIRTDSDEYRKAITEDDILKHMSENPGIKSKDFKPGKVYDYEISPGKTERILYLGKMDMFAPSMIQKMKNLSWIRHLDSYCKDVDNRLNNSNRYGYYGWIQNPWDMTDWVDICNNDLTVNKNRHVFLVLHERGRRSDSLNAFSLERMLGHKNKDNSLNFADNIISVGGGLKIRKESDDQRIMITDKREDSYKWYGKSNTEYVSYTIDDVLAGYREYMKKFRKMFEYLRKLFPIVKPDDLISEKAWQENIVKLQYKIPDYVSQSSFGID